MTPGNHHRWEDRRRSERRNCSTPVWLKYPGAGEFSPGWMIEESSGGAAFLVRGRVRAVPGMLVQMSDHEPGFALGEVRTARICRTERVHGDIVLVAAEYRTGAAWSEAQSCLQ